MCWFFFVLSLPYLLLLLLHRHQACPLLCTPGSSTHRSEDLTLPTPGAPATAWGLIIVGISQATAPHQTLQTPVGRTMFGVEDGVVHHLGWDANRAGLPPVHRFSLYWPAKQLRHERGSGVWVVWDCRHRGGLDDNTTHATWPPAEGIAAVLLPALEV